MGARGEQVCCRRRTPPTGDVRDRMAERCKAPHSKAAAVARNSQLPDHVRQPVRQPPVREEATQWIAVTPRGHPRPVGTLWSAALCAAFRCVSPWPGSSTGRTGPASQVSARVYRLPVGQTSRKAASERPSPPGRGERYLPSRACRLPPSEGFPAVHPRSPQSPETMGSAHFPDGPFPILPPPE
jgi:hypothetical protein